MSSTKQTSGNASQKRPKRKKVQSMLRIGATFAVPDVLQELGADPSEVLAGVNIDLSLFDNPNNPISYLARGRMLEHCATQTGCPHFGLLVGQKAGLASLGIVGLLAKYSTDVGTALNSIVRYMHLHVRGARATVAMEPQLAVLEYQIYQVRARGNDQVGDGAVAVIFNMLRELCGSEWAPAEVRFAHRVPNNESPYQEFFQAPLRFNAAQYGVAFPSSWLSQAIPDTSPELRHLIQQEIDKLETRKGSSFLDHLRSLLRTTLVTRQSSADQVAELLSMSRRTLNRHLNELDTNFQEVVDEIRFEIARQLLEDSAMEIAQIALFLGYSNASSFTRAFQRWSATTPAHWRCMVHGECP